mmetsp:Transcript_40592/g.61849  ORF Transcript_40592/g.61849 Transcript_40592/m.61849 type:complete len:81 (+) Transcript_40592:1336-1578(+)
MKFHNTMLSYAERLLIKRRRGIRQKRIDEMLKNTMKNLDYREKSQFIEQGIESDIHYFKSKGYEKADEAKDPYKVDFIEL